MWFTSDAGWTGLTSDETGPTFAAQRCVSLSVLPADAAETFLVTRRTEAVSHRDLQGAAMRLLTPLKTSLTETRQEVHPAAALKYVNTTK